MYQEPQLFQVRDYFLRTSHIRLRDDLDQRYAASVIIYQRTILPLIVNELSGILFHMDLVNSDLLFLFIRPGFDLHIAIAADREIQLGDLIVLRIIRIEVILPVKLTILIDLAVGGQAYCGRILHHLSVEYRQRARHPCAHRAGVGIGSTAELCAAGTEDLCFRSQLHMDFQPDYGFILFCHFTSPPYAMLLRKRRNIPMYKPPGSGLSPGTDSRSAGSQWAVLSNPCRREH